MTQTIKSEQNHQWAYDIPSRLAGGQSSETTRDCHEGMERAHSHSTDFATLYFEVVSYPNKVEHQPIIQQQQPAIANRFSNVTFTPVETFKFNGRPATEFTFESDEKTRRFIFIDGDERSYRIIYNPLSNVNHEVLESFRLTTDPNQV